MKQLPRVPDVAVVTLVCKTTKNALFMKRSPDEHDASGTWCNLGGKVEDNETALEALYREVLEESGLSASYTPLLVEQVQNPGSPLLVNHYVAFVDEEFEPVLNEEHDAFVWAQTPPNPVHKEFYFAWQNFVKPFIDTHIDKEVQVMSNTKAAVKAASKKGAVTAGALTEELFFDVAEELGTDLVEGAEQPATFYDISGDSNATLLVELVLENRSLHFLVYGSDEEFADGAPFYTSDGHTNMGSFMQEWTEFGDEERISAERAEPVTDFAKALFDEKKETANVLSPADALKQVAKKYKFEYRKDYGQKVTIAMYPKEVYTEEGDAELEMVQNGPSLGVALTFLASDEDFAAVHGVPSLAEFLSRWNKMAKSFGLSSSLIKTVESFAKDYFDLTSVKADTDGFGTDADGNEFAAVELALSDKNGFEKFYGPIKDALGLPLLKELLVKPNKTGVMLDGNQRKRVFQALNAAGWKVKAAPSDNGDGSIEFIAIKKDNPAFIATEDMDLMLQGAKAYYRCFAVPTGKVYPQMLSRVFSKARAVKAAKAPDVFQNFDTWEKEAFKRSLVVTFDNKEQTAHAFLPPKGKNKTRDEQVGLWSTKLGQGWLFAKPEDFYNFSF